MTEDPRVPESDAKRAPELRRCYGAKRGIGQSANLTGRSDCLRTFQEGPIAWPPGQGGRFDATHVGRIQGLRFLNSIIQFLITAIALFFLIKGINMVRKPRPAAPTPTPSEIYLKEIRDAVVKGK